MGCQPRQATQVLSATKCGHGPLCVAQTHMDTISTDSIAPVVTQHLGGIFATPTLLREHSAFMLPTNCPEPAQPQHNAT